MSSGRVLIVDDDQGIRELLRETLESAGIACAEAADGWEMRDELRSGAFDLAVIDAIIPNSENGLRLAEIAADAGVDVLLMTGQPALREAIEKTDFNVVVKPFSTRDFLENVKATLDKAH